MTITERHGIVVVDKPAGMTSHDVVATARKLFRTRRIGHTGTLDPDATGVLVLCIGQATRLAEYLSAARKHYVTEVVFGQETDSQDASGIVLAECDASHLTAEAVDALLPTFQGTIQQIPPMVSARHHEGKRLYELAREGITVEREARAVTIFRLERVAFVAGARPVATLEVTCSSGTYIRTLAADLGASSGVGAFMRTLRREWVGEPGAAFALEEAWSLAGLTEMAQEGTLDKALTPIAKALLAWPQVCLDSGRIARLRQGQSIEAPAEATVAVEQVAVLDEDGHFIAVGRVSDGRLTPVKVLTYDERL